MQVEFLRERSRAQVGQRADATACTMISTTATSEIPFGVLVVYDEADAFLCKVPTAKAHLEKPLGITLRVFHCQQYEPKSSIIVMRKGRVWVEADKIDAPGDPVFVKLSEDGKVTFTGVKTGNTLLRGAIFLEKSDSGLTPIELNFFGGVQ